MKNRSENSAGRGQILTILPVNSHSIDQKSGEICTGQANLQPISFKSDRLLAAEFIPIQKLTVFGVGLIGGSLALALKAAGAVKQVVGVGRNPANMQLALTHGLIDSVAENVVDAVRDAEMVVLAMPVGQMAAVMQAIALHVRPGTVVTDAGSTKLDVVSLMRQHLAHHLPYCVPAHPIAGAELSGPLAARADLYKQRQVVLTPLPDTTTTAIDRVTAMWRQCGASVTQMHDTDHDATFAAVSHLPHVLAYALVDMLAGRSNAAQLFEFAASGFRDFTRIAASSPEMWRDIALSNQAALLNELDAYQRQLTYLHDALAKGDGQRLLESFARAQTARQAWSANPNAS